MTHSFTDSETSCSLVNDRIISQVEKDKKNLLKNYTNINKYITYWDLNELMRNRNGKPTN